MMDQLSLIQVKMVSIILNFKGTKIVNNANVYNILIPDSPVGVMC